MSETSLLEEKPLMSDITFAHALMEDVSMRAKAERIVKLIRTIPDFPKQGILFRDFIPVFTDAQALQDLIELLVQSLPVAPEAFDSIAGLEARGFLLGTALAMRLHKGFISVRKAGKLPPETYQQSYQLEYGSACLEIERQAVNDSSRVLIIDDLLATGGSAHAAQQLIEQCGARVVGFSFVMRLLGLDGASRLQDVPCSTLLTMPA